MKLLWTDAAWEDYVHWQESDPRVLRRLNELIRLAAAGHDVPRAPAVAAPAAGEASMPSPLEVAGLMARTALTIAGGQLRYRLQDEDWFVAWAPRAEGVPGLEIRPAFREIASPPGRLLADPFLAEHDGHTYLFVESCPHRRKAGVIAVRFSLSDQSLMLLTASESAADPISGVVLS